MTLPSINLRRTLLIAQRDYLGYVKTVGFWVSFCLPFLMGIILLFIASRGINVSPVRYEAVLDETGQHRAAIEALHDRSAAQELESITRRLLEALPNDEKAQNLIGTIDEKGFIAARTQISEDYPLISAQLEKAETAASKMVIIAPPVQTIEGLKPYLRGELMSDYEGSPVKLNGVIHIYDAGSLQVDYWSANFNALDAQNLASRYFRNVATERYLAKGGLNRADYIAAHSQAVQVNSFDPTKLSGGGDEDQAVTIADRMPYFVAFGLSMYLWMSVFSGSYMLLTSMLEEKMNKLLEMMLASTRFSEIIFGKLLGIAALTLTATLPYILIGLFGIIGVIAVGDSAVGDGIISAFTPSLIGFFAVFLVLGYVFYGSLFIALGAMSESMQDAQTLTTPIMFVLMGCMFVIPLGLSTPDSPILIFASLFPLSAPFAMIVRLPSDPPLWQLAFSVAMLLIVTLGVIALSGRMFRYGVLSGAGVKGLTDWFKRRILRRQSN